MATNYDLVILGGGTGGYVAAIRASQLGLNVAIVEKGKLGGTCLHSGCIPSKALLRSAEVYTTTKNSNEFGIESSDVTLNFAKVQLRKQKIVEQLYNGVKQLMKKGKIDVYEGRGRILGPSIFSPMSGAISVEFTDHKENEILIPKNLIIATGSRPRGLPGLEVDGNYIITSNEALELESVPKTIVIVGGGVIGIEWASMLCDFGAEVTVVEFAERILSTEDEEISREMAKLLKKKGVQIVTSAKVLPETVKKENGISILAEHQGKEITLSAEKLLVSVGRIGNTDDLGLQNTEIQVKDGYIVTNNHYQTKESHIYAIGDVIGGLQLAHVASHEGMNAVEHMTDNEPNTIDYSMIPKCIYSSPEVASVGLTEKEAEENGFEIKVGKFPFQAIGKALVNGNTEGFVKVIADQKTNDLLGVHMIGPHVTDLISEAGLAHVLDATPWEVGGTIHPHPSLSEAIGEAALAVDGIAIHI